MNQVVSCKDAERLAIHAEIGSPLMITNTTQLEKKAIIALDTVVRKIKEASTQAIV